MERKVRISDIYTHTEHNHLNHRGHFAIGSFVGSGELGRRHIKGLEGLGSAPDARRSRLQDRTRKRYGCVDIALREQQSCLRKKREMVSSAVIRSRSCAKELALGKPHDSCLALASAGNKLASNRTGSAVGLAAGSSARHLHGFHHLLYTHVVSNFDAVGIAGRIVILTRPRRHSRWRARLLQTHCALD